MCDTEYPALVGSVFPTDDNPRICDWQENQSSQATPRRATKRQIWVPGGPQH